MHSKAEAKRKYDELRKDYDKKKEMIRDEAARKNKALNEDNKLLHKYVEVEWCPHLCMYVCGG